MSAPKKPRKTAAVKKAAVAKTPKAAPAAVGSINIITPDSSGYDTSLGRRAGRKDGVTPHMGPILDQMVKNKTAAFQLEDRNPFTVYQIRGWIQRMKRDGTLPSGVANMSVGGGTQNDEEETRNIHVSITYA